MPNLDDLSIMKIYLKKIVVIVFLMTLCSSAFSGEIVWCGVDKDTGDVNKYWCFSSQQNCEQGKPWQYVCVAMPKPK